MNTKIQDVLSGYYTTRRLTTSTQCGDISVVPTTWDLPIMLLSFCMNIGENLIFQTCNKQYECLVFICNKIRTDTKMMMIAKHIFVHWRYSKITLYTQTQSGKNKTGGIGYWLFFVLSECAEQILMKFLQLSGL